MLGDAVVVVIVIVIEAVKYQPSELPLLFFVKIFISHI